MWNLLDNAVKYSPDRTPIEVTLVRRAAQVLEISVRDHGLGIPPARAAVDFPEVLRGAGAGGIKGTGIGLAMVSQIVSAHGGESRSRPSARGSTFMIVCPPRSRTGMQILIVEDEPESRWPRRRLRRRVTTSAWPATARAGARQLDGGWDLIVLDVMLPKRTASKSAARSGAGVRTPIMMLTARTQESEKSPGPRHRRRRLRHQAVQPARAAGAGAGAAAASRARRRRHPVRRLRARFRPRASCGARRPVDLSAHELQAAEARSSAVAAAC